MGIVIAVVVASAALFIVYKVETGHLSASKHRSSDSYNPTAWKFADLVRPDVLYPVVRDIDGDTIVANVTGHEITVRLIGIDTPETVDPRKSVQCYGPEASAEAKRIFASGVSVYLDRDPLKGDYDKYGRLLAYIRLPSDIASGTSMYNEYMLMQGFAREYTFSNEPYKYQAQFRADEAAAKKARRGLWGNCPT